MAILQSSGTKNDLVSSLWLSRSPRSCSSFAIAVLTASRLLIGLATGLALLTRPTAYLFALPFFVWFVAPPAGGTSARPGLLVRGGRRGARAEHAVLRPQPRDLRVAAGLSVVRRAGGGSSRRTACTAKRARLEHCSQRRAPARLPARPRRSRGGAGGHQVTMSSGSPKMTRGRRGPGRPSRCRPGRNRSSRTRRRTRWPSCSRSRRPPSIWYEGSGSTARFSPT